MIHRTHTHTQIVFILFRKQWEQKSLDFLSRFRKVVPCKERSSSFWRHRQRIRRQFTTYYYHFLSLESVWKCLYSILSRVNGILFETYLFHPNAQHSKLSLVCHVYFWDIFTFCRGLFHFLPFTFCEVWNTFYYLTMAWSRLLDNEITHVEEPSDCIPRRVFASTGSFLQYFAISPT